MTFLNSFLLLLFFVFLGSRFAFGQKSDLIIMENDSLKGVKVLLAKSKTNVERVTFKHQGETKEMKPADVLKIYANDEFYLSEQVKGEDQKQLLHFIFQGEVGILNAYQQRNGKWKEGYFLKTRQLDVIDLYPYRQNLRAFFHANLDRFGEFEKEYKRKVKFTYVSLGTLISHYNHFLNPEKYEAVKFKPRNSEKIIYTLIGAAIAGYLISKVVEDEEPVTPFSVTQ